MPAKDAGGYCLSARRPLRRVDAAGMFSGKASQTAGASCVKDDSSFDIECERGNVGHFPRVPVGVGEIASVAPWLVTGGGDEPSSSFHHLCQPRIDFIARGDVAGKGDSARRGGIAGESAVFKKGVTREEGKCGTPAMQEDDVFVAA